MNATYKGKLTMHMKQTISISLVIVIREYWKQRNQELLRQYLKENIKALRYIYSA
jgi:hypothetical protein